MAESVQRCEPQTSDRFGPVHAIGVDGQTKCGLEFAGVGWWVLGPVDQFPPTCKLCKLIADE